MDVGGRAVREGMAADKIMRRVGGGVVVAIPDRGCESGFG